MHPRAFEETLQLLRKEFLPVHASHVDYENFGSWWIDLSTHPPVRALWDGKEGWAIVQTATSPKSSAPDR